MNNINTQYLLSHLESGKKPRERMICNGPTILSDMELLCVLIGNGVKGSSVYDIATQVLEKIDMLKDLLELEDLQGIPGLGKAKALRILSAIELGKRIFIPRKWKIQSPQDLIPLLAHYSDREEEYFIVCTLNGAHEIIANTVISRGVLNRTLVHPREVFKQAIKDNAASIIVAHNHPSGNTEPSDEDIKVTNNIIAAGNVIGITVLDHIIFTTESFYSFTSHGLM